MVEVYLTNAAGYATHGARGKWVKLPCSTEQLARHIANVLADGGGDETMITDYTAPFTIDEHHNIVDLNNALNEIDSIKVTTANEKSWPCNFKNMDLFVLILNRFGASFEDAIQMMKNETFQIISEADTLETVVLNMLESGYVYDVGPIPKHLVPYFEKDTCDFEMVLQHNVGWKHHGNLAACIVRKDNPIFTARNHMCRKQIHLGKTPSHS